MVRESEQKRKRLAPYVSAKVLSEFFDHIRYVRTPEAVDSALLQDYGVSQASSFALLSTLKFLGLTDDRGQPTPVFRNIQSGGDDFKDALRGILETSYADLFSRLDVSRDTRDKIVNFFARNSSPATAERAARLFLDLCGEAGIPTASQPRARSKSPSQPKATRQEVTLRGQQPPAHGNVQGREDLLDRSDVGPNIDIRINSQDLVNMEPEQIKAIFEGLSRLAPHTQSSKGDDSTDDPESEDKP